MPSQITVTLIVVFLGLVSLGSLAATAWIFSFGEPSAEGILAISSPGTTALGGIIGLLGRISTQANTKDPNA